MKFPRSVAHLEGVQYIRISGHAGRTEKTVTNLNQLSVGEITRALVSLCDYCSILEGEAAQVDKAIVDRATVRLLNLYTRDT